MENNTHKKRWIVSEGDSKCSARLVEALGVSPIVAKLLTVRGITDPESAECFLNPSLDKSYDPLLLPDCERAVNRIINAIKNREKIFIHGDYDVDGMTSCAIWTRMLRRLGANVKPHLPNRQRDGYGVHHQAVDLAQEFGSSLIITCDCGIQAHDVVEYAREKGIDVVVTDHHEPDNTLPKAVAVVNPHRKDSRYPFKDLSGAGVSFKVAEAVAVEIDRNATSNRFYFRRAFLDLATLGTVADVVPLTDENRIIVANGLERLSKTKKPGLKALMEMCGIKTNGRNITTEEIGFRIGPRLNAVGRLDDAGEALELLLTEDEASANKIAKMLELRNSQRRQEQDRIYKDAELIAVKQIQAGNTLLFVAGNAWHTGIVGIIAGKLTERFNKPVLAASLDESTGIARGSARSIRNYNLVEALRAHENKFLSCGGHALAAGFSLRIDDIEEVHQALNEHAERMLTEEDLMPAITADIEIEGRQADEALLQDLERFQPYGEGNPQPVLLSRKMLILNMNLTRDGKHVQCQLRSEGINPTKAIAFDMAHVMAEMKPGDEADVVYTLQRDTWNGGNQLQWMIKDMRKSSEGDYNG